MSSELSELSIEFIQKDINKRFSTHINSMCATDDEVTIAWLLGEVIRLEKKIFEVKNLPLLRLPTDQYAKLEDVLDDKETYNVC